MNDIEKKIEITENICHYLLLFAVPFCHDGDEWLGIYHDNEMLKKAYEKASAELAEKKTHDKNYASHNVEIWQFRPNQEIRQVKPEELHKFL
ncbi:MAG: hypothetical protein NC419_06535 [Muribaculaceae bacterium]|nr:hypothetical protein [Muribaculaceae bacterium]